MYYSRDRKTEHRRKVRDFLRQSLTIVRSLRRCQRKRLNDPPLICAMIFSIQHNSIGIVNENEL